MFPQEVNLVISHPSTHTSTLEGDLGGGSFGTMRQEEVKPPATGPLERKLDSDLQGQEGRPELTH